MTDAMLSIRSDEPIGRISPRLYGHFAEHLGRCCYDGVWAGPAATVPTVDGFRRDVVDALRALPVPLLRWPGGCYADHYHWRDGVGPPAARPRRLGMSCGLQVLDDNGLGTDEFIRLCSLLGAEPYLAGNVGSGSPAELCDWVEYCNSGLDTTLARERRANGAPRPYGVRLWGVGNENWGCGGNFDVATYAAEYRRFATMLRHVDPEAELVACGYDRAWNARFLDTLGESVHLVDHLSIHDYWTVGGPELGFDADAYYSLLAAARGTEAFVARTAGLLQRATSGGHRIGVALDEWGVWHPEARAWGPGDVPRREPRTYEQANTLRDGLACALALHGFHRRCDVLTLANLAQVVNVLQAPVMTDGPALWLTPTYHALRLHAPHLGATAVTVEVEGGERLPDGQPAVTATASVSETALAVSVVNQHWDRASDVVVGDAGRVGGAEVAGALLLSGDRADAQNTRDNPNLVAPTALAVRANGRARWRFQLPAHSLATIQLERT